MESFNVYLPMDRRVALSRGESLPDRSRGAVLLADVSGFTPLTEMLVQKLGRERGAEEMTFHLNRVYDVLIGKVDLYRGSVISFAGDAITCWFDGDDGRRALTCAFAMQTAMVEFKSIRTAVGDQASISIKASIAAGDARRFLVGNPRIRSIETLAGKLLDRVASGEKLARQGEVIVDDEVVANLHIEESVFEWRGAGNDDRYAVITSLKEPAPESPWEPTPIIPIEQARDWLLPAIHDRLMEGGEDYLAELRPAVALFLKFTGIDYDTDNAGELLDQYVRGAQSVAAHYEGNLIELSIGDKGSSLYVIFGAPQAHEDDAARAAGAAVELVDLPEELQFIHPPQIGISLGLMRTGSYGSRTRRSYGAQGPQVNLANRLMSAAKPGQILVSQVVVDASRRKYQFASCGEIPLKGVAHPVPAYELQGPVRMEVAADVFQKHKHTVIFGREKEREYLSQQLDALRNGEQTSLTFIQGEAGIGKSRLVAELVDLAGANGIPAWVGAGDTVEHSTPYLAWRPVLARYFGLEGITEKSDTSEIEAARQTVVSYLEAADPALVPLTPLLNVFLPVQFHDNEVTSQLSGEVRGNQTQNLCVALLKHATSRSPHVLIVEDAHWLDSASWILLNQVSSAVPSLMTVIAMRPPDPMPPDLARLFSRPNLHTLSLDSMSASEIETLVCYRLGITSLPPAVSQFIHERAEGNPFFSEELAYALRDTGLIRIINGLCELSPDAGDLKHLNFPDTIDGVIISRIDALKPQEQLMLKVASVIGRIFALRTLHDIHPVATDRTLLSGYLDHLRALDITPLEAPAPNEAYIFRHIITHEVAYNLLLFQQRRDLHRIVADWYERVFGEDLSPHYPLLAHHWRIAEDAEKQIKYLELSGENALRNGAYRESIVFFLELIALNERSKLVDDAVRIAHWERALGEAYFSTGDFSRSKRYHVLAVKRLGRPFSPNAPGLILQLLGEAIRQVLHRYFPSRFVGTITDPALVERYLEGARAYERISHIVYFENNTFGTVAAGIASLNLSERVAASPESVRAYGTTQVTTGLMGMHNASLSYERLAKESSEAVRGQPGFLAAEGWRLMMAGTYHAGAGSLQTAIAAMDDAIAIWETLGEKQRWKESLSLVSTMNVYHSDLETAYRRIEQFYQAALQEQNEQFRFWALLTRAMALRREGKLEDADAALKAAVSGEIVLAPSDQIWHGGVLARVLLGLGQFDLAKKEADTAADLIAASQPTAYYVLTGYSAVIEVYLAGMEQDLAKRGDYQKRAWKMIGKLKAFSTPFPIAKTRLHLLLGRYHALSAKTSAVLPALHKSLEHAETFSLRYDRAQAHLELSKYVRDHEERRKHRQAAEALFAEAGAESEAKRIVVE